MKQSTDFIYCPLYVWKYGDLSIIDRGLYFLAWVFVAILLINSWLMVRSHWLFATNTVISNVLAHLVRQVKHLICKTVVDCIVTNPAIITTAVAPHLIEFSPDLCGIIKKQAS